MSTVVTSPPIHAQAVTRGVGHHFFGYYDKSPWDASGRWMLGLETTFMDRPPTPEDKAVIGLIDTEDDHAWTPLAETGAWNWQQGCMLQWLGDGSAGELIYNDREGDRLVARVLDIHTRKTRTLPMAVYGLNRQGTHAVTCNFGRLHHQRPGYGYPGIPDRWQGILEPADDGVFSVDIATGATRLVLSTAQAAAFQRKSEFDGKIHRFNHLQFGPAEDRFACLHRYKVSGEKEVGLTRLLTVSLDGSDLHCLSDHGMVSHYDWRDEDTILAWARRLETGHGYYLFQDYGGGITRVGADVFSSDGHCLISPDGRWLLTDTYPDAKNLRTLMLYHWATEERIDLGQFFAPPVKWQIRCDLHPRWNRNGTQVCIDSIHEGTRQIYVLDVSEIVNSR